MVRNPPHKHFHCKDIFSARRRNLRLAREGWIGKIEPSICGFILSPIERISNYEDEYLREATVTITKVEEDAK